MPELLHHPVSAASRFIRLVAGEIGFATEMVEEPYWQRRPELLSINPAGQVPVLVADNGYALCGATIIAEYLDEVHGVFKRDKRLLPGDPYARAETRRLIAWFLDKMEHDVTAPLVRERIIKPQMPSNRGGGSPDSKVLRIARANIRQHMKYLSWLAASRPWLAGETLSYADLAAAAGLSVLDYLGEIDWAEQPHAKDWYQRLKSRPAFRPLLADRVRALAPVAHYADLDF
ncbi:glutathione S-transferase family protein [Pseudohoeflea coraliihabitans]|uniref:Glutathione S-transferase family protein n=1 Tax=Pseudohoeflea coraliihabitans TaxID=2860393 RepID=A0ABS6WSY6_9HYPH|nr:glutathione S-transferase family protein [Pseudohoeflea sp. DP4N28-3]MBW3099068.1 glutathione S-transferase family protein [Pseudohoeflea sp. DP4N28-3]